MINFSVGDKVVCINNKYRMCPTVRQIKHFPVIGQVYTIRGFTIDPTCQLGVWLEEIINPIIEILFGNKDIILEEPAFDARYFKPVKKTDISMFHSILGPTPTKKKQKIIEIVE